MGNLFSGIQHVAMKTKHTVRFRLNPFSGSEYESTYIGSDIVMDMDSLAFEKLAASLTDLSARRLLYPKNGYLTIELIDTPETPYSWFEFKPSREITHVNDRTRDVRNELTGNAQRAKPGMHIGDSLLGEYVSETVKEVIERNGFTGAEFIWVEDNGLYRAPQWFWLTPQKCIGRGVDHPFFDIRKRTDYPVENSPAWRFGVRGFKKEELRSAAPFESPVWNQFVSLFIETGYQGLQFRTYRQYLRDYLPDTDFAYGRELRRAFLCLSRRVRDTLLASRLVDESECHPILILDSAPMGVEIPDALGESEHSYSHCLNREEVAKIQREKTAAYQEFLRNPKKRAPANLKKSLKLLKGARKRNSNLFAAGATESALKEADRLLSVQIPLAWREILKVSDGFLIGRFQFHSTDRLPNENRGLYLPMGGKLPDHYLCIGNGDGDLQCLDLSMPNQNGDYAVHEIDHEGPDEPVRVWSSVAEFIEEALLARSADEADD